MMDKSIIPDPTWWGNRTFFYPFLFPLLIFGYLAYDRYTINAEDKAFQLVSVSVLNLSIPQENNLPHYVSCLGTANNKSEYNFGDMTFQAFFFSESGSLIDTFQIKDEDTVFLANKATDFRIRNLAQEHSALYASCTLEIVGYGWAL